MKLLNRTTYLLITSMLFVFLMGSIAFYGILKYTTENGINHELQSRMAFMADEIEKHPDYYNNLSIPGYITVKKIALEDTLPVFSGDTILLNLADNSYKQYKTLRSDIKTNADIYQVVVYKSLIESNELIERIILIVTIIFILFILFLYLINRFMFGRIWSSFFKTVEKMKSYNVNTVKNIEFGESEITEFKILNSTLNQMIEKIRMDYENVKEFTGNISHEIQTPLSVIRLKCDLLIQTLPLNNEQASLIRDIQHANTRLSNLNKTLVLLTKIENNQFTHKENVSLFGVIERHLENFASIAEVRSISINCQKKDDFLIEADPVLIDVLVINLIKNAIAHNIENGILNIEITQAKMIISNSGQHSDLSDQNIFERYKKVSKKDGTFGLGLSLAKNICDLYNLKLFYHYSDRLHHFTLSRAELN